MRWVVTPHLENDHSGWILVAIALCAFHIDIIDRRFFGSDQMCDIIQVIDRVKLHVDRHVAQPALESAFQRIHEVQHNDQDHKNKENAGVHADPCRHTHADGGKKAGSSGKACDLLVPGGQNSACGEETGSGEYSFSGKSFELKPLSQKDLVQMSYN